MWCCEGKGLILGKVTTAACMIIIWHGIQPSQHIACDRDVANMQVQQRRTLTLPAGYLYRSFKQLSYYKLAWLATFQRL